MLIADSKRTGRVETVIRSAGRWRTCIVALEESGLALCLVLAGVLLMLLLGAQILRWYWLLLLGIIGIGIAAHRLYLRRLSRYRIAQLVDRDLQLSDSLSTAWFLLSESPHRQEAAVRFQLLQAEDRAASVDPRSIFRFRGGRTWAAAGVLAVVVFGLFAVRYLVTSSLSIQQAMISLQPGETIERIEGWLGLQNRGDPRPGDNNAQGKSPAQSTQANKQTNNLASERTPEATPDETKMPSGANEPKTRTAEALNQQPTGQARGQSGTSAVPQQPSEPQPAQTAAQSRVPQQIANSQDEKGSNDQNSPGLVDKVKEALSSLMAKLRPDENSRNANRGDQGSSQDKESKQGSAAKDRNGNLQQSARNNQSSPEQNAEGAMRGRTAEKTQTSQNQSSDESSDQKSANSHSGIGHTNGDKDIKDAEQLKAMGKLAEIIGKRSASLTGDITVETSSTNQQLRTQYSGRVGEHSDLGGEINRDEIPVMYRDYVREYMRLVHKQADEQH